MDAMKFSDSETLDSALAALNGIKSAIEEGGDPESVVSEIDCLSGIAHACVQKLVSRRDSVAPIMADKELQAVVLRVFPGLNDLAFAQVLTEPGETPDVEFSVGRLVARIYACGSGGWNAHVATRDGRTVLSEPRWIGSFDDAVDRVASTCRTYAAREVRIAQVQSRDIAAALGESPAGGA